MPLIETVQAGNMLNKCYSVCVCARCGLVYSWVQCADHGVVTTFLCEDHVTLRKSHVSVWPGDVFVKREKGSGS